METQTSDRSIQLWHHITNDEKITSEWEVATPKVSSVKSFNWRKIEIAKWSKLVSQGLDIGSIEWERAINFWIKSYRGTYPTGSLEQHCR